MTWYLARYQVYRQHKLCKDTPPIQLDHSFGSGWQLPLLRAEHCCGLVWCTVHNNSRLEVIKSVFSPVVEKTRTFRLDCSCYESGGETQTCWTAVCGWVECAQWVRRNGSVSHYHHQHVYSHHQHRDGDSYKHINVLNGDKLLWANWKASTLSSLYQKANYTSSVSGYE